MQDREFSNGSGLEWYDSKARTYDFQLGRVIQIDPEPAHNGQESLTPYQFESNDPVRYNDPSGKCPSCFLGAIIGVAVDYVAQVAKNRIEGQGWKESVTSVSGTELGVAALAGFATSGVSPIYADAAVAGTTLAVSKPVAQAAVTGVVSMLDQANEAADKGKPLSLSPFKVGFEMLTDNVASKIPGNETAKTTAGAVISTTIEGAADRLKKKEPAKAASTMPAHFVSTPIVMPTIINQPEALQVKTYIPQN